MKWSFGLWILNFRAQLQTPNLLLLIPLRNLNRRNLYIATFGIKAQPVVIFAVPFILNTDADNKIVVYIAGYTA